MNFDQPFKISENVVCQEVEGQTLLLNALTGHIFGLDQVSSRVWELMQTFETMNEVKQQMLTDFDVDEVTLREDLGKFVESLMNLEIIASDETK